MRSGKISGKRFAGGHANDGITSVIIRKAKALSHRCRPPRLLRVSPIDAGQKITQLGRRDRHHAIRRRRPQKATVLQTLHEQARTLAVVPDHLQKVAATSPEAKQMSTQRVAAQHLLHLERQAGEALPHVGVPRGQPDPHAGRNGDHRRRLVLASALSTADTVEVSTAPVIRIRPPVANSISTVPACSGDGAGKDRAVASGTGATATGLNTTGAAVRLHNSCRHRNSWLACIPASRATSEATTPGSSAAATSRSFSARDHRRRRCTDVITSTCVLVIELGACPSIRLSFLSDRDSIFE
jgi:hypothetical protein